MGWRFYIDRGGTFTDVVCVRPDGTRQVLKLLSHNPEQYPDAALEAIRRTGAREIDEVKMGTTVATNALLERQGDPTVLVITRGFADLLAIGDQTRPDIFAMNIQRPQSLHCAVVEAEERVSAGGDVLTTLDIEALRRDLDAARARGITSVAIALLHGYKYPAHERIAAEVARAAGFEQVSVSHELSPLMKLVPRGDTTVADAYLSPILRRYIDRVSAALGDTRLLFMQSNGGLAAAERFRGKDSVLSGPAGGVVGAVQTAAAAGFDRIIGFDMGGTSTDVSHYAGEYERTFETVVAGVRLVAPMMAVHTVAAGGGSVLHYDGQRYRVGPDSAGAVPGPVCYRRGGPLTITDCNLMLGKLQPRFFPAVFGETADQPLDSDAVHEAFAVLSNEIGVPPETVAEGFVTVAVETMARAIKKISVERGHDVSSYTLSCFGGAGGQHACQVADAMGMTRVHIHPDAGVLSAWGIGIAARRELREQTVERALDEAAVAACSALLDRLAGEATAALGDGATSERRRVHVRYAGTDSTLNVPFGSAPEVAAAFEAAHHTRFGFAWPGRAMIVAALAVEVAASDAIQPVVRTLATGPAPPLETVRMVSGGQTHQAPVYRRDALPAECEIDGPAMVLDDTGTTIIEPQWRARVTTHADLIVERVHERVRVAAGTNVDPMLLAVFNHRFMSVAEQMGLTLENTAMSVNIKERRDYSCAVFDAEGRLVANAPHIPVHLGSMGACVEALRARVDDMRPGDAYMLNDPYGGGTHLPDITVVTPLFIGDVPAFFTASRGHHADIGGITPGSMPPHSTTIDEEGVLIRDFLLVRDGRLRELETRALLAPSRNVDQNVADLQAQVAANTRGLRELQALIDEFSLAVVTAYMGHVRANAAESVRRLIDGLEGGAYRCEMDDGCAIEVAVTVDKEARRARVDFTGTSPQQPNNANAPTAVCKAVVLYVFRTLTGADIPLNSGCLEPLEIIIEPGSMLAPRPPAAVVAGNVETSQVIADALFAAVGALAGSQGTMNNLTFGNAEHQYYETICGGAGAGHSFDGASAVHTHMTNSRLTDPEVLEWRYPVRVEAFGIRKNSGGHGRYRGGDGSVRRLRFLEPMTVSILSNRRVLAPHGLDGGGDGAPGSNKVVRAGGVTEDLGHRASTLLNSGDLLTIETPGGGAFSEAGQAE